MENYDFGQLLGEGGFASVYNAFDRLSNREVAIKCINKAKLIELNLLYRVENEIQIHERLKNINIIEAFHSFEDDQCIYIVMELCNGGNLFRYLKRENRIEEMEAVFIIQQIIRAIDYLHANGLVHRDLKLSNILINKVHNTKEMNANLGLTYQSSSKSAFFQDNYDENNELVQSMDLLEVPSFRSYSNRSNGRIDSYTSLFSKALSSNHRFLDIKLCDFGLTVKLQHPDEEHYTLCGTPNYIAPEIVNNEAHGYPADVWSIGALYYSLTMGQPLFAQKEAQQWLSGTLKGRREAMIRIHQAIENAPENFLSVEGKDFLLQIFQADPKLRPSISQMLQHQLLTKYEDVFEKLRSFWAQQDTEKRQSNNSSLRISLTHDITSVKTEESPFHANGRDTILDGSTEDLPHYRPTRPEQTESSFSLEKPRQDLSFNDDNISPSNPSASLSSTFLSMQYPRKTPRNIPRNILPSIDHSISSLVRTVKPLPSSPHQFLSSSIASISASSIDPQISMTRSVQDGLSMWAQNIQDISLSSSSTIPPVTNNIPSTSVTAHAFSIGAVFAHIIEQLPTLSSFLLHTKHRDLLLFTNEGKLVFSFLDGPLDATLAHHNNTSTDERSKSIRNIRLVMSKQQKDRFWLGSISESMQQSMQKILLQHISSSNEKAISTKMKPLTESELLDPHNKLRNIQSRGTVFINDRSLFVNNYQESSWNIADESTCKKEILCSHLLPGAKLSEIVTILLHRIMKLLKGVQCHLPKAILYCSSINIMNSNNKMFTNHRSSRRNGQRNKLDLSSCTVANNIDSNVRSNIIQEESSSNSIPPPPPLLSYPSTADLVGNTSNASFLDMKCMLMCNTPLPDFHAQWLDGTRLIYRLETGHILIDCPCRKHIASAATPTTNTTFGNIVHAKDGLKWEGILALVPTNSSAEMHDNSYKTDSLLTVPSLLQPYLLAAQCALTRCMQETNTLEKTGHFSSAVSRSRTKNNEESLRKVLCKDSTTSTIAQGNASYPIIIVDKN